MSAAPPAGDEGPALPPCWSRPPEESWGPGPSPRGWLQDGDWHMEGCALPSLQQTAHCLRDTALLLLGDSNMKLFYDTIKGQLGQDAADCGHVKFESHDDCQVKK